MPARGTHRPSRHHREATAVVRRPNPLQYLGETEPVSAPRAVCRQKCLFSAHNNNLATIADAIHYVGEVAEIGCRGGEQLVAQLLPFGFRLPNQIVRQRREALGSWELVGIDPIQRTDDTSR